ncbi:phosphate/phosphite/phosphonate ABC transporter substrate-binding protein [Shouchella clausii]|uniref:Phosphonate-binding protein n=1 Tax=Shouchella clausii TaxID=79880 RepID=A0A268S659_SHOCL|nr:phosphate/phosphite/phosphonate ABC transporter substrate-binding protein [Shouchella clausii]PAD42735.1 phosphonate-binding protein [Bacillus sp. 7520-S]MBU8598551.1 phosphate/phosphite/phosphonate ABC transporter substrate-binding protein [Shouchella clausii]MCY1104975.1 phosphate/phosphite/phosphonate ABC transporter substrate-binding protein [Shouchella clausii]MEB5481575.1 phosphate/phosphite/phosphonate ABC transporter substrate-binding protein [Shouchella clausii]MED4157527.1 phospha
MKKKVFGSSLVAVTALVLAACGGNDTNAGNGGDSEDGYSPTDVLKVQFVPSQNAENLDVIAAPLEELLSERLDIDVEVSVSTDYPSVVTAMGSKTIDVGFLPPNAYVTANEEGYADVLLQSLRYGVNEEDGSPTDELVGSYKSQFVVMADSDIESLEDLEGKTIAFQGATSSAGYVWPAASLLDAGIDPQNDVNGVEFQGHDAALIALLNGEVDAAVTFQDARNTIKEEFPDVWEQTRVVALTEDIPNDTVSVRSDLSQEWRDKIADAFIDIGEDPEGRQIIFDIYSHEGYELSEDSNFDIVRDYAERIQQP